jgi:hypothetical protein
MVHKASFWRDYLVNILGLDNVDHWWTDSLLERLMKSEKAIEQDGYSFSYWNGVTGTSQDNLPIVFPVTEAQWVFLATSGLGMVHIWGLAESQSKCILVCLELPPPPLSFSINIATSPLRFMNEEDNKASK